MIENHQCPIEKRFSTMENSQDINHRRAMVMETRLQKMSDWFIVSASVLLALTGFAKIVSVFGNSAILAKPDPIFGIRFNYLLLSAGLVELIIAILCLMRTNQKLALGLVAAISMNFLGYRVGLWFTQWPGYCPCLGTLTQAIHISPQRADLLTQMILAYLLVGSFFFLVCSWWALEGRRRTASGRGTPTEFSGSSN